MELSIFQKTPSSGQMTWYWDLDGVPVGYGMLPEAGFA